MRKREDIVEKRFSKRKQPSNKGPWGQVPLRGRIGSNWELGSGHGERLIIKGVG